jgi:hypothetical protein
MQRNAHPGVEILSGLLLVLIGNDATRQRPSPSGFVVVGNPKRVHLAVLSAMIPSAESFLWSNWL